MREALSGGWGMLISDGDKKFNLIGCKNVLELKNSMIYAKEIIHQTVHLHNNPGHFVQYL